MANRVALNHFLRVRFSPPPPNLEMCLCLNELIKDAYECAKSGKDLYKGVHWTNIMTALAANLADMKNSPVLDAWENTAGELWVYCKHCSKYHVHGKGDGHRVAHCNDNSSPYQKTGYYLICRGVMSPEVVRNMR